MKKQQVWWMIAGAGVLLLALLIAIVTNKDEAADVSEVSQRVETAAPATPEKEKVEPQDPMKEDIKPDAAEQPVPQNIPEKRPSAPPAAAPSDANNGSKKEPVQQPAPKPETEKQATPAAPVSFTSGTYEVGNDLDPGEYIVFSDGITLLENTKDQTGNPESIVFNIALDGRSHTYVTLRSGEYFTLQGGKMYPVADAPDLKPENGIYKDGQYKVGTDIPAGSYTLVTDDQNDIGFYEISKDSRQDMTDLVAGDVVEGSTSVSVTDGQYLTIRNAVIDTN